MDDLQKFFQRNFRRILAGGALMLSLLAISILLNTSPSGSVWMVTSAIPTGTKITANEIELIKGNLAADSAHFLGAPDAVIGQYATRSLPVGDLVAVTDVDHGQSNPTATYLPIGVAVDDLPLDLAVGDLVDIYVIPKDQTELPAVVAHRVTIQNIDQKSRALGGSVAVSVSASATVAAIIITAESQGRLVLARDPI
jgi:SAF domain